MPFAVLVCCNRGIVSKSDTKTLDELGEKISSLHRKFGGVIYDLCLRILHDPIIAEDAVQDTFISAYRSFSSFRYGDNYLPWLYRIATNACKKILRQNRNKSVRQVEFTDRFDGSERDPIRQIHAHKVLEYLVDGIDDRGEEILIAHYIWGMNQSQVADSLGITRRAVVKRLSALRKRVRQLFREDSNNE